MKIILHLKDGSDGILALRAARHLIDRPKKSDALLQYGGDGGPVMWALRNKSSVKRNKKNRQLDPEGKENIAGGR